MKRIFISIICISLLALIGGCLSEDEGRVPDGVWSYIDESTNSSCILDIGGANAVSSGGVYSRLTICDGTDNYDIMIGGTLFNVATGSGEITFSESSTGKPNKAYFLMLDDNQITLRMGEGESKTIFLLTRTSYPKTLVGLWGGSLNTHKGEATLSCNLFPTAVDGTFGAITFNTGNEDSTIDDAYNVSAYTYNSYTGEATFKLSTKGDDQVKMRGKMSYNYIHDVLEGIITDLTTNQQFEFTLSPSLTLETLK